nr:acyltransferase domain-containing protein [Fodinicola feengrottensis]
MVVLRPLSAAVANGDRIYALVRGSAVNSDGASNGLTAPNPAAQRAVLAAAYADGGVAPDTVDYVECHGTGTLLGDPIEAAALGAVVGGARTNPCLIGSVKTNIGHLEAAAGMAGLIKVCLSLHHGRVPASLHVLEPNPHIDFAAARLRVATNAVEIPGARLAGVSSFGFSGTNAHAVLASPPVGLKTEAGRTVLPLSARTREGLQILRQRFVDLLETSSDVTAISRTDGGGSSYAPSPVPAGRPDTDRRTTGGRGAAGAAYDGGHRGPAAAALRLLRSGFAICRNGPRAACCRAAFFSFCYQALRRGDGLVHRGRPGWRRPTRSRGHLGGAAGHGGRSGRAGRAFAGIRRHAGRRRRTQRRRDLSGGDQWRPAAGCGYRLAARRGLAMAAPGGAGAMLAVEISAEEAEKLTDVSVAAVNSPGTCVLSGDPKTLGRVRTRLSADGVLARWVKVDYAFHSPRMAGAAEALGHVELEPSAEPAVPFWSALTAAPVTAGELTVSYWSRGILERVRFSDAVAAAVAGLSGIDATVELGGHPVLRSALRQIARRMVSKCCTRSTATATTRTASGSCWPARTSWERLSAGTGWDRPAHQCRCRLIRGSTKDTGSSDPSVRSPAVCPCSAHPWILRPANRKSGSPRCLSIRCWRITWLAARFCCQRRDIWSWRWMRRPTLAGTRCEKSSCSNR